MLNLDVNIEDDNPIFASLEDELLTAGISSVKVAAFIGDIVSNINGNATNKSTLFIEEVNDLANEGWTLHLAVGDLSPNAYTSPDSKKIFFAINLLDLVNSTNDPVSTFVGALAYEIGHAEDLQLATTEYVDTAHGISDNALGIGAEVAMVLLSEAKSGYNLTKIQSQDSNINWDLGFQEHHDEQNSNPQQALLLSAADAGVQGDTTSDVNFLYNYWSQVLHGSGLNTSNTDANVLGYMDSMYMAGSNLTTKNGMVFSQGATNNAITMTVNFANNGENSGIVEFNGNDTAISSYSITFDGGVFAISPAAVGEGNSIPLLTNAVGGSGPNQQVFVFASGGSLVDKYYSNSSGFFEELTAYNGASAQLYQQTNTISSISGEIQKADISGQGDSAKLDSTPITLEINTTASIVGTNNTITLSNADHLTLSGTGNIIAVAAAGTNRATDTITFDGQSIAGKITGGSINHGMTYSLNGSTLTITNDSSTLTINNFQFGDFGINPGPGYYVVRAGDTWTNVISHSIYGPTQYQQYYNSILIPQLQRVNAAFGVTTLSAGTVTHIPVGVAGSGSSGAPGALPPLAAGLTYVYDVTTNSTLVVGASLDGHDSGALIFDAKIGTGTVYPIFDKGTYSSPTYDSNTGNVSVVLQSPDAGSSLGTFFLNISTGVGTFTLTDGTTLTLSNLAASFHVTTTHLTSEAALLDYLSGLGDPLTAAQLQQADYTSLHGTASTNTVTPNESYGAGGTYVTLFFNAIGNGTVITGENTHLIQGGGGASRPVEGNVVMLRPNDGSHSSYDIAQYTISNVQALMTYGNNVTLTHAELAQFTGYTAGGTAFKGITGGGKITLADGGAINLAALSTDAGGTIHYDLAAQGWQGTTLTGDGENNQILTASLFGNDTLIAGSGTGDQLIAGLGQDTLTGGNGGDTFYAANGLGANSVLQGGSATTDVLNAGFDISHATISGIEKLNIVINASSITLTAAELASFTGGFTSASGSATINAATAGVYVVNDATNKSYNMVALSSDGTGTTLEEHNPASNVTLTASISGSDTLHLVGGNSSTLNAINTTGDDHLKGESGNGNLLDATGSTGNDVLDASGDVNDVLRAGDGNDTLYGSATSTIINGGAGTDTVYLSGGYDIVTGGTGDLIVNVGGALTNSSHITGGSGSNTLVITNAAASDISLATLTNVKTLQVNGTATTAIRMTAAEFNAFTTLVNTDLTTVVKITITTAGTYSFAGKTLKGNFQLDTANTGGKISGQGVTVTSSNATISLASATSATVMGNSDTVTLQSTDTLTANGNSNSVSDTASNTGNTVNDSTGNVGTIITLNGTSDIAKLYGSADTVNINGASNQVLVTGIGAALASGVTSFASGVETITVSGETINVASGVQATITGTDGVMIVNNNATTPQNIINWNAGGSELQEFTGLMSGTAKELIEYTGVNATGTITKVTADFTAGGSQIDLYNPTSGISLEHLLYSGLDGTGANTATYINFASGGSELQQFAGLPTGVSEEITDYSGADETGMLLSQTIDYANGSISSTISGQGVTSNVSNATVSLATGASATVTGNSDSIILTGSANTVNIVGTADNIYDLGTGGNSITLSGNSGQIRLYGNTASDTVSITGTGDSLIDGSNGVANSYTFNAANDSATLYNNGDSLTLAGTGDTGTIYGTGDTVTVSGSGDNFYDVGTGGNSITLSGNSGKIFLISNTVSDTVSITGTGDSLSDSGNGVANSYTFNAANDSANLINNGDSLTLAGSGDTAAIYGTGDMVTVSGSGASLTDWGTGGNSITLSGNSESAMLYGNTVSDTVSITGTGDSLIDGSSGVSNSYTFNAANDSATLYNNGDSLTLAGSGDTGTIYGTGDTVTMSGSGDNFYDVGTGGNSITLSGNSGKIFLISNTVSDTVSITGTGDSLSDSGHGVANSYTFNAANDSANLINNGDSLTLAGSGDMGVIYGTGDTVTASGSGDNIYDVGTGGNSITLSGNSGQIRLYGNTASDTVSITGTGDSLIDGSNGVANSYTFNAANDSATLINNGDALTLAGSGDTGTIYGTGDTVTMSGSGDNFYDVGTGGNSITLSGDSGNATIYGTVSDTLTVGGSSNAVKVLNSITGTSTATISGTNSLIEFGGATTDQIFFGSASTGKVLLDSASSFAGTVAGMANGDVIDLGDFVFSGAPTISNVVGTGAIGTVTNVTITDGSAHVMLALLNQYANQFGNSASAYSLTADSSANNAGTLFQLAAAH